MSWRCTPSLRSVRVVALKDMGDAPDPKMEAKRAAKTGTNRELAGAQTAERQALVIRRERDMIELRIAGASLSAIAEHYEVDESVVSRVLKRGFARMKRERAELREQELGRLDKIVRAWWEEAVGIGTVTKSAKAAGVVVQAIRERVKLGQLDQLVDDDGPNETPAQRADRVAESIEAYLKGRADQQAESPPVTG